jgi:hypothetical protein
VLWWCCWSSLFSLYFVFHRALKRSLKQGEVAK